MTGRIGFHFEKIPQTSELTLRTSDFAKNWTEHSPKSKLYQINVELASAKSNEAKELRNLINKREYRQFQKRIGITSFSELDGKLGARTFDYFNNYLRKIESTRRTTDNTNKELRVFRDYVHKPEYQELTDFVKIHKASREYLSKHESMSEAEYNKIFSGKEQLAQGQLGNCYLVSGFIELTNTQYFNTLMRTSISRVKFKKDGALGYSIRIPLGEPDGRDILIKDSELKMSSVTGNVGYKLLELAYVKNKRKNNREGNKYAPVNQWEMLGTEGGSTSEVLKTFLGRHNIGFSDFGTGKLWKSGKTLSSLPQGEKGEIINYLRNFNGIIGNSFTDLLTAPSGKGDKDSFQVGGNILYKQHAYALSSVDKNLNVYLKNPWNDKKTVGGDKIKLSLNEFFHAFSYIGIGKIKINSFLDNKGISRA